MENLESFKKFFEVVSRQPMVEDVFIIENHSDKIQSAKLYGFNEFGYETAVKNAQQKDTPKILTIKPFNESTTYMQHVSRSMSDPMLVYEIKVKRDEVGENPSSRFLVSYTDANGTTFQEKKWFLQSEYSIKTSDLGNEHFKFVDGNTYYEVFDIQPKQKVIVTIINKKMNTWANMLKQCEKQINNNENQQ